MMNEDFLSHVDRHQLGVQFYGGRRHIVNSDGPITEFFCGQRGVRVARRYGSQKPTCPGCISEARRVEIRGV